VIKVIWGSEWDLLLEKDKDGILQKRMTEAVDGEYQAFKAKGGAYTREHFWNTPELKAMVAHMTDHDLELMSRGGHNEDKVYAAYSAAVRHSGQPTVILTKTVKGYGMGDSGEGQNTSHQQKKMDQESLLQLRDRFRIPVSDEQVKELAYVKPAEDSAEIQYLHARRSNLGGYLPSRSNESPKLDIPELSTFSKNLESTGDREISTTMAFVRILSTLIRDKKLKDHIVPIVPDEARTFGMEGLFRQLGIYASEGQKYQPEDSDQLMYYREDQKGQVLEEGINEAGAMSSWMRTTLAGEGLQHQDGHSHIQASTIPNCVSYDPTYSYELAVIVQDGLKRMYHEQENVFYYITIMNENYAHPEMPEGSQEGILKGLYLFQKSKLDDGKKPTVQLMGSGTIFNECRQAAEILENEYGVAANLWSATSMNELRRDGCDVQRWNMLHPDSKPRVSYVEQCLSEHNGPVIAATDYDGFGRSDDRAKLREHFEVNHKYIVVAALFSLMEDGSVSSKQVKKAIKQFNIDPEKLLPDVL